MLLSPPRTPGGGGSEDEPFGANQHTNFIFAGECRGVMGRCATTLVQQAMIQRVGPGCIRAVSQLLGPRVSTAKARHFAPRTRDRMCASDCVSISPTPRPSRAPAAQFDKSICQNSSPDICSEYAIAGIPFCHPNHSTTTSFILNPPTYIVGSAAWQGLAIPVRLLSRGLTHRGSK